jgi:thiamine-phosphate pyrophosphorylase
MPDRCRLYYITDRTAFSGNESIRRAILLGKISEAARCGVDYIQLREKDLPARELELLAREAAGLIRQLRTETRELKTALLINSRTDIAVSVRADGVHLRSKDVSPADVRVIWNQCGAGAHAREVAAQNVWIGASCHSPEEVAKAAENHADFAVFAPVFEKRGVPSMPSTGLAALREACQAKIPVLALGGVTIGNARACLDAGAAGIAGIRLFQENSIADVVKHLRG